MSPLLLPILLALAPETPAGDAAPSDAPASDAAAPGDAAAESPQPPPPSAAPTPDEPTAPPPSIGLSDGYEPPFPSRKVYRLSDEGEILEEEDVMCVPLPSPEDMTSYTLPNAIYEVRERNHNREWVQRIHGVAGYSRLGYNFFSREACQVAMLQPERYTLADQNEGMMGALPDPRERATAIVQEDIPTTYDIGFAQRANETDEVCTSLTHQAWLRHIRASTEATEAEGTEATEAEAMDDNEGGEGTGK